ncbi:MAG: menaquinone biosynthesis protein [Candidatus Rokubacteria bacterium]|nr:menaquinone biosynthesis protein [Candidatus Rokubacteria bacterium]
MLRIGHIPYLNCEPYFIHLAGVELISETPRALGQAMAAGGLDAAPLSLMDALRLEHLLVPLPFGIASRGPVRSVLLFSDRAPSDLDGAVIGVTDETATSVELLRVLLALKHEVTPRAWVGPQEPYDAILLIGDKAIREAKTGRPWKHVLDIAGDWHEWTGLPCVFARWSIRAAVPAVERDSFAQALGAALGRGMESIPAIAARRRDTGFDEREVAAYLRNFTYRFGPDEDRSIADFRRLRGQLDARR